MNHSIRNLLVAAVALLIAPHLASAHPGHGGEMTDGFLHPLLGIDHVLAMVAVGLWAAQLGGRAVGMIPAVFVGVMVVGAALGAGGIALPLVETGIASSVLVLGVLIAAVRKVSIPIGAAIVGSFAILHGHAHGAGMIAGASTAGYVVGLILATTALLSVGVGLHFLLHEARQRTLIRLTGGAIAASSLIFFLSNLT